MTVIESGWVSVRAAVSVTLTVNEEVPPVVGVPVIAPVEVFSASPAGSEPPGSIDQVVGNVPPVACKVALYETPTAPPGRLVVVIVGAGGGATVIESSCGVL